MNENDLFSALSMIDPKYIDEAAFELKDDKKTAKVVDISRKRSIKKILYIALPSVAAILLIVAVAIPAIVRITHSSSATMSEAASEAPTATEAPEADKDEAQETFAADEAASKDETPASFEAEAPSAEPGAAYDSQTLGPVNSMRGDAKADTAKEAEAAEELGAAEELEEAETAEEPVAEAEEYNAVSLIEDAVYDNKKLTLTLSYMAPEVLRKTKFTVGSLGEDRKETVLLEEALDTAEEADGKYIIDLTDLDLPEGTYYIRIDEDVAEFTVPKK